MNVPFNRPCLTGHEQEYLQQALDFGQLSGDGEFTQRCHKWFLGHLGCGRVFMTPSCTQALEMSAFLANINPGDEVIMPSYTFVSTANAFVLRGAKIVFVDISPETMNLDPAMVAAAITSRTKAIVPVHYGGVACDMDLLSKIAAKNDIVVIEDSAQGVGAYYKGRPLGTIGHLGTYSFHDTKNLTSGGEGGLLLVNSNDLADRAEIVRDKGTNRRAFLDGLIDKYTWVDLGSSYLPSELQAAFLYAQLEHIDLITKDRLATWNCYKGALLSLGLDGIIGLHEIPSECTHNAHIFFIKCKDREERYALIKFLKSYNIDSAFHYVPLHSSPAGQRFGNFFGPDNYTTKESERLLRLPLWFGMPQKAVEYVVDRIASFYRLGRL